MLCQDLAPPEPYAILAEVLGGSGRDNLILEKGTRRLMRTHDRFWKLFANTGSIYAYLMYRQVNQSPASS